MILIADCYMAKQELEDAKIVLQTILDSKPKQEYIDEVNSRLQKIQLMQDAMLKAQPAQSEMKVEFNTSGSDDKLFTQPVNTVPADTTKKQPLNVIPN